MTTPAVVCAMRLERAALLRVPGITVVRSGVGRDAAARAAARLASRRPALIASVGLCGALDPGLRPGDLVVATEVLDQPTGRTVPCDAEATAGIDALRGLVTTVAVPLLTVAGRRGTPGVAVDMESGPVACAARSAGIPFACVRAVSDSAATELPEAVLMVEGPASLSAVLKALHPRHLGAWAGLARGAAAGCRSLRGAARELARAA